MDLSKIIRETYPQIKDDEFIMGSIKLQDDGDGIQYIAKWEYSEPLPSGLSVGKPSA